MLKAVWKTAPLVFLSFLKQDTEQEKVVRLSGVTANEVAAPSAGARIFHC